MAIKMILASGLNYELGANNKLLWHLPDDLRYFKEQTEGHYVVMGNNTFKSLNMAKGLKNRKNIVLTTEDLPVGKRVVCQDNPKYYTYFTKFTGIDDLVDKDMLSEDDVWIIGGASIYEQLISFVDEVHWTEVLHSFPEADTFVPKSVIKEFNNNFTTESVSYFVDEVTNIRFRINTMKRK